MSHILMLCHDQRLDRRVLAQAESLISIGHSVVLLALSFDSNREISSTEEGVTLIRIGLDEIIPSNHIYQSYIKRQYYINDLLNHLCNKYDICRPMWNFMFRFASGISWWVYRLILFLKYKNRKLGDPLPFTSAYIKVAQEYKADLVQVHDLPTLEAGVFLASQWSVPLVYDAHELYPEQRSFSAIQRKICSDMEARLIQKASLVFAVNQSIANEMVARYIIKMPIVLHNAINPPNNFNPNAQYNLLREKLGLSSERKILLFQGGFAPHRNLEKLINAIKLVEDQDVDLVLMGFGDYGDKLKAKAKTLGLLNKRIYFIPAVALSELLQHSASADIGIIPYPHVDLNSYFCTPNKLFEFIQARLPILANDSPELRRFVVNSGFGVVMPMHTAQQIAKSIDYAFSCPEYKYWKANLLTGCEKFSWSKESKIYLTAMSNLLAQGCIDIQYGNNQV